MKFTHNNQKYEIPSADWDTIINVINATFDLNRTRLLYDQFVFQELENCIPKIKYFKDKIKRLSEHRTELKHKMENEAIMTDDLPEIIKTYESLTSQLQENELLRQSLEHNRELSEIRLSELITMAKNAKEIGVDNKYPIEQIKELDDVLIETIAKLKLVNTLTWKLEALENEIKKEGYELGLHGIWFKIESDEPKVEDTDFINALKAVKEWVPTEGKIFSVTIENIDEENESVFFLATDGNMEQHEVYSFEQFKEAFKPKEE